MTIAIVVAAALVVLLLAGARMGLVAGGMLRAIDWSDWGFVVFFVVLFGGIIGVFAWSIVDDHVEAEDARARAETWCKIEKDCEPLECKGNGRCEIRRGPRVVLMDCRGKVCVF